MITVVCVLRSGGVYTPDWVVRLRDAVDRNLTLPHRFVCLSDVDLPDPGIETIALRYDWPSYYAKVEIFRPDLERLGRILFIDLSCVIVGNIDAIAARPGICVTRDFYFDGPSQSVLIFGPGDLRCVWDKFVADPAGWMVEGEKMEAPKFHDQVLMYDMELPYWQDELPGQVVSFKVHCRRDGRPPAGARIVKFHGNPKPDAFDPDHWVGRAWRQSDTASETHLGAKDFR